MTNELRDNVIETRRCFSRRFCLLPMKAKNAAQRALMAKHGSPFVFAQACTKALGEISVDEAETAIAKYLKEWKQASSNTTRENPPL